MMGGDADRAGMYGADCHPAGAHCLGQGFRSVLPIGDRLAGQKSHHHDIGLGWNAVEYEALGENFTNRGKRSEEQVEVMRKLWTERSVTFNGKYHRVTGAGLAPLPNQRPIPLWFGAASNRAYERAGRLGDGWLPMMGPGPGLDYAVTQVKDAAVAAGRDADGLAMEGRVSWSGDIDKVAAEIAAWKAAGATHLSINTMDAGLATVDHHLAVLERVARDVK